MPRPPLANGRPWWAAAISWIAAGLACAVAHAAPTPGPGPGHDLFRGFDLPDAWKAAFWAEPGTKALVNRGAAELAALVPTQAGLRFCRCPACGAAETDEPLRWSAAVPDQLTCRSCRAHFPDDKTPARDKDGKIPEDSVEVRPGLVHRYPYHAVEPERQRFADERIYLAARRDYEIREHLSKLALYAAVRHREKPDPKLAVVAAALIVRFAQVYPDYAIHYDQPGEPKFFQPADLPPPYRLGYRSAKWDWSASLDVPLNLLLAYAIVREGPELAEAGRLLEVADPRRLVEDRLFRASAEFVRRQPVAFDEQALMAHRGLLAVGRLLDDAGLVEEALERLGALSRRGFFHDGMWREGEAASQRRVVGMLDGWIDRLLNGERGTPMVALARAASSVPIATRRERDVRLASWPAQEPRPTARATPRLLGGSGLARLSVGGPGDSLDLELHAPGALSSPQFRRLSTRIAMGGRMLLADRDEAGADPTGFDRATASHNTVLVDGLNQRETPALAGTPAPGGNPRFFAAEADFQVAAFDDPAAYPLSASRYRHTVVAFENPRGRYLVSAFEVHGGLQHDQPWHVAAGSGARWHPSVPLADARTPLLAPGILYLKDAHAENGRWFVQALGAFDRQRSASLAKPAYADLHLDGRPVLRAHLLGDLPAELFAATTPDPLDGPEAPTGPNALVVRRRSRDGETLTSRFVTLFECPTNGPAASRVGRVGGTEATVVLYLETADGPEHLIINPTPGLAVAVTLADGRPASTDGLVARIRADSAELAGGTYLEVGGRRLAQPRRAGRIDGVVRSASNRGPGWFVADAPMAEPEALVGRVLLIHHGDGTVRGWTLARVENTGDGRSLLHVDEEPGFLLDADTGAATYYQFPGTSHAGPHEFTVCTVARGKHATP